MQSAQIYSVSELTAEIKSLLESRFSFVWLTGEISNFSAPQSGHFYFSLKDDRAQIRAVMFRSQNRQLKFRPENGMSVTGMCRVGVYEPRGTYQVIFEYLEPAGVGALQIAFEQLKGKLQAEGLFDAHRKRPLPVLPRRICLITSPSGAVVHDILRVALRRFPNLAVEIIPVHVQGDAAVDDIVRAVALLNRRGTSDVAILARGGGSLEDLQAFNSEPVARALFASQIPIVSAVGHETDVTIADFVADLRAPTPSAAAELVVPQKSQLLQRCADSRRSILRSIARGLSRKRERCDLLSKRLVHPKRRLDEWRLRIDDWTWRLARTVNERLGRQRETLAWMTGRLHHSSPLLHIENYKQIVYKNRLKTLELLNKYIDYNRFYLRERVSRLHALNPAAVLARGYSITKTTDGRVVREARTITPGQRIDITVAHGSLRARVRRVFLPQQDPSGRSNGSTAGGSSEPGKRKPQNP
jgi:exodeoxyribonuclease VII large subunit